MGVMSRRVLPVCGRLFCFCPSLRARSRQPVKRYKKLIADIFPRSQDGQPNERMMGKLCEYTFKNPMRVPKITDNLEQRFYKELRNERFHLAKTVPRIYSKFLASCKEQIPLFATSMLSIIRTLLDQTRQDDMRILGCLTLVDFLNNQTDSTYMFNIEGFISKLYQLCQENEGDKGLLVRSAALQALSSMVRFMSDYSHISLEFDKIVSVTLVNYKVDMDLEHGKQNLDNLQQHSTRTQSVVLKGKHVSSFKDSPKKVLTPRVDKTAYCAALVDVRLSPSYWSRICLQNMVDLAKEATTTRRVLEPLLCNFDEGNYWSPDKGIASSVLSLIQELMENSEQKNHLLLFIVKHLDHKNVAKDIGIQVNIIKIVTHIAQQTQLQASVSFLTAICDLIRHLRKCLQCSIEESNLGSETSKQNSILHSSLEVCLMELTKKVGDSGPILDMMAVVLDNLPTSPIMAKATLSSVFRIAQMAVSIPNLTYKNKVFTEALFHQLLLAMTHTDHEIRVGAHRIFSVVLQHSNVYPWTAPLLTVSSGDYDQKETFLVALSGFASVETILEKLGKENCSLDNESGEQILKSAYNAEATSMEEEHEHEDIKQCVFCSTSADLRSMELSLPCISYDETSASGCGKEELTSMRLSGYQVGLLLSSIWAQAFFQDNNTGNYDGMMLIYYLALLFSQNKSSSHVVLVQSFQLAFSLRRVSLDHENHLPPSNRRSLYTLSSSMLILSAKAGDLSDLASSIKACITSETADHYLDLVEDSKLLSACPNYAARKADYGSEEDNVAALKFLESIKTNDDHLREIVISHLLAKYSYVPEQDLISIREQLQQEFSPDDDFPLGTPMFMDSPSVLPFAQKENETFEEVIVPPLLEDGNLFIKASNSDQKISKSKNSVDVLNVDQLIESVLETAQQASALPMTATVLPYEEMKSQCEALVIGKHQRMSVLQSFKSQRQASQGGLSKDSRRIPSTKLMHALQIAESSQKLSEDAKSSISNSSEPDEPFRLPPSSPYDKFLKAAGW